MRYSRVSGVRASVNTERPQSSRPPSRGVLTRESCDSTIRLPGTPLRGLSPTSAELVARNVATIFLVPAVILLVAWVAGSGFRVSVPVEREQDDQVRSEGP